MTPSAKQKQEQRQFHDDVLEAIATAHKAGLGPEYMADFLRDAIKALTTPALWVAHRKTLTRKRGEMPWH